MKRHLKGDWLPLCFVEKNVTDNFWCFIAQFSPIIHGFSLLFWPAIQKIRSAVIWFTVNSIEFLECLIAHFLSELRLCLVENSSILGNWLLWERIPWKRHLKGDWLPLFLGGEECNFLFPAFACTIFTNNPTFGFRELCWPAIQRNKEWV